MSQAPEIWFYKLATRSLREVLPDLLEKTLARGWRAVLRIGDSDALREIDSGLWTWRDESFLPHGSAADGAAPDQPVWLTGGDDIPNGAQVLFLLEGASENLSAPPDGLARICLIFDGGDDLRLAQARAQWRVVMGEGLQAVYWAENEAGGWTRIAQTGLRRE